MLARRLYQSAKIILFFVPVVAFADCYQESVTQNTPGAVIKEIVDYKKFVKTVDNKQICTVMFKARINNQWHDARSESQGLLTDSTDQICSQALTAGRITILERIAGTTVRSTQTLYCNDFEIPQLKKGLKKNDTFKLSELKPHADSTPFEHQGTMCRYFLESDIDPKSNKLMQWQIVGCVIRNEWTVVDKF
jgi:hypothetical protein